MTATTVARRPESDLSRPALAGVSIPLMLFCVIPLLVALAVGGWVRLAASVLAVGAGAGLVADGFLGLPWGPVPGEPVDEGCGAELERAS